MKLQHQFLRDSYPHLMEALLELAKSYDRASILNSHGYDDAHGKYEFIAAFGAKRLIRGDKQGFSKLEQDFQSRPSWLFGHLNFDLKNQLENLESNHAAAFGFLDLEFFEPQWLIFQNRGQDQVEIHGWDSFSGLETLLKEAGLKRPSSDSFPKFQARMSKKEYLNAVFELKKEIQYGRIYEINYCQEFFAQSQSFDPYASCLKLWQKSAMPFAAFYKTEENYLLCASPERFLCKTGERIVSQPIKGTIRRGANPQEDEKLKSQLKADLKEQTENVMIVDLVRNDLSRTAQKGSVQVSELFGVYTFPQVHQLISTVESKLHKNASLFQAIEKAFPMGSMTGAPKLAALKLIEKHEKSRRELYSGSVGYISPSGDFDLNVVIRSLMYSSKTNYLSFSVGGALTHLADPEQEYEECLLKAKVILDSEAIA